MVQGINDKRKELAHVRRDKIRFVVQLRREIGQVRGDHFIDITLFIVFIKFIKTVREKTECGADEYPARIAFFYLSCNVQHASARGDHIVDDDHILAVYVVPEEFMGDDRVLAVYDHGIIAAFIEHTHVYPQNVGEVYGSVHGSFIGAYDHQMILIRDQVRNRAEDGFHELVGRTEAVESA